MTRENPGSPQSQSSRYARQLRAAPFLSQPKQDVIDIFVMTRRTR